MEPYVIPESPEEAKLRDYATVYDGILHPPTTSAGLYEFLVALTGIRLPFEPVCSDKGHGTPWDYLWRSYRIDLPEWRKKSKPNLVYVGSRGGYKTMSVAMLIAAELLLKPGSKTVGVGAIENHSTTTNRYVQRFLNHEVIKEMNLIDKMITKEIVLRNGSTYAQAVATRSGVNSWHAPKLRVEEADLMKPEIIEEAKLAVTSFKGVGITHTSYVSSRKELDGVMDNMVQTAEATDSDVIIACYKDVSENCPEERRGRNPKSYEVEDIFDPGKTAIVTAFENCGTCPLLPSCRGDLARAHGLVSIDDAIKDWKSLDRDTWIYQKECALPKATNLFFSEYYDDRIQSGHFPYNPTIGWVDMVFDFTGGGEDPTVCLLMQTDDRGYDYVVAEMVFHKKLVSEVGRHIKEYFAEHEIKSVRHQLGDSAAQTWIAELNNFDPVFFRIRPTKKIQRRDGWGVVKRRLRDGNGVRQTYIDSKCRLLRHELKTGKRSKSDLGDLKPGQSDHAVDTLRYRQVEVYEFGLNEPNIKIIGQPNTGVSGIQDVSKEVRQRDWFTCITDDSDDD